MNTLYTSIPAQKLMSTEELVKRTVALEEIPVPDQPRVRSTIVACPDNPVQCRKECGDEGFIPSAEWQREKGDGYRSLVHEILKKGHKT